MGLCMVGTADAQGIPLVGEYVSTMECSDSYPQAPAINLRAAAKPVNIFIVPNPLPHALALNLRGLLFSYNTVIHRVIHTLCTGLYISYT